ncbi:hypothetical protein ABVK25_009932 [Lepraria finkii]|uniref:Uncharacterized protein n=1 Tax=Lepraria finkii TaxID=1340010 RepID=A0ABR4AVZ2_9LECA
MTLDVLGLLEICTNETANHEMGGRSEKHMDAELALSLTNPTAVLLATTPDIPTRMGPFEESVDEKQEITTRTTSHQATTPLRNLQAQSSAIHAKNKQEGVAELPSAVHVAQRLFQ